MATSTPTRLITVEEFRRIPEPAGDFDYELHQGELVSVTRPRKKHHVMQDHLVSLLKPLLGQHGYVSMEVAFRAVAEHDLRCADVAFVSAERWRAVEPEDNLHGAPDLVIEILSASNTAAEMYEREQLCLESGAKQFWTLDLARRQIRIATPYGPAQVYGVGQEIPLTVVGGQAIAVADIFAVLA